MRSVVSNPAPTSHRRPEAGDCAPSTTHALDRLAVQGAVNVVSTWWASEGRRRRGGRGRRADAGTHTYRLLTALAPTTSFPSRHPTPAAGAIYTGQGLHTSSGNAVGTTTTYGSPPYYVSAITPAHPTAPSHMWTSLPFASACDQVRLRFPKRSHDNKKPNNSGSRRHSSKTQHHRRPHPPPLQPHAPAPTNPPAPCRPTTPGMYKAGAWVRAPGGSITLPPPPPPERVRVEGAYFASGTS